MLPARKLATCICLTAAFLPRVPLSAQDLAFKIGTPEVIAATTEWGGIFDLAVAPDGSVFVADRLNTHVLKVGLDGVVKWTRGAQGGGPTEYGMIYRVAAHPDGGVVVYDLRGAVITKLDADGNQKYRAKLPFALEQLTELVVLANGNLAIAGVTSSSNPQRQFGIHVFSLGPNPTHIKSFGKLSEAVDRRTLEMMGSGNITLGPTNQIVATLHRPYELQIYTQDGKLINEVNVQKRLDKKLDDQQVVTRNGSRTTQRLSGQDVPIPITTYQVSGATFFGGVWSKASKQWLLISDEGKTLNWTDWAEQIKSFKGMDIKHHYLYASSENEAGEPVLLRMSFDIVTPKK